MTKGLSLLPELLFDLGYDLFCVRVGSCLIDRGWDGDKLIWKSCRVGGKLGWEKLSAYSVHSILLFRLVVKCLVFATVRTFTRSYLKLHLSFLIVDVYKPTNIMEILLKPMGILLIKSLTNINLLFNMHFVCYLQE